MPAASITVTSGSDRVVYVHPGERTSSGSASRSRVSSRSITSSEESWSEIDEDDIDPSDSASRGQPTSRRHNTEARAAPAPRASSRRVPLPAERERARQREELPPRRHSSRRQHVSRHDSHESRTRRSSSRRVPSDESSSTVASSDDYPPQPPYGHPGAMPRAQYPPQQSGYRHVPAGYPPSMTSGGAPPYADPYAQPHQALVHMRGHDPFGYPQQPNPFGAQGQPQNPFSPMSSQDSSSYFATDVMGPPPRPHRPDGPPRPQSFIAPPSHYGSEMIASYHPSGPYGPYAGMPYPPYGPPMHGWSPPPAAASPPPPAPAPAAPPPPPEKNPEIEALKDLLKDRIETDDVGKKAKQNEIQMLKDMIKQHEARQAQREKEWIAEREAEAAARAAEKARIEEEKKRQQELADARKKAKEDAESKAADAAKKAKEEHEAAVKKAKDEHDAKLAEAEKAKAELEAAKKALEEDIAKNKPTPDSQKAPIRFKDAVGRKFSFPWHICKTWKGMETLIRQAFLHVDMIGEHVHQGHYDLTGPDGEIILPQVWDTMVQPDWDITMHLWPMEEEKPPPVDLPVDFSHLGLNDFMGLPPDGKKKSSKKDGKKVKKPGSPETIVVPPMHHGSPPQGFGDPFAGMMYPPGAVIDVGGKEKKSRPKSKSMKGKEISPLAAWFAGGSLNAQKPSKKEDEKQEIIVRSKAHPSSRNGAPQTLHDQGQCLIM